MATLADLMRVEGRAELVKGEIVLFRPLYYGEATIVGNVFDSLRTHQRRSFGDVHTTTLVYALPDHPSGRQSISPAFSWYHGPLPENDMGPIIGPPTFAGEFSEQMNPARLADYFEAGTRVIWEVFVREKRIRKYTPDRVAPTVFDLGGVADAEPAIPGWRITVDAVFEDL
jgi:hypothetical protein